MSAAQIERKRTEHSVVGYLTGAMSFAVASAPALADTKKDAVSATLPEQTVTGTNGFPFDRSFVGSHAWTVEDLTSHDLKIGLRWTCCDVPAAPIAPPPLIRKG